MQNSKVRNWLADCRLSPTRRMPDDAEHLSPSMGTVKQKIDANVEPALQNLLRTGFNRSTQPIFAESKRQAALFRLFAGIANQRWLCSVLGSQMPQGISGRATNLFTYAHGTQFFVTPVTNAT